MSRRQRRVWLPPLLLSAAGLAGWMLELGPAPVGVSLLLAGWCLLGARLWQRRQDQRRPRVRLSRLSRSTELDEDGFCVVSLPQGLDCGADSLWRAAQPLPRPLLAVVDDFTRQDRFVGARRSVSHGELVSRFALNGLEDRVSLLACDLGGQSGRESLKALVRSLEFLLRLSRQGCGPDALLLSLCLYGSPKQLTRLLAADDAVAPRITTANIGQYKTELRAALTRSSRPYWRGTARAVDALEALSARGTAVFLASGNRGENQAQLLALCSQARVVGGCDETGRVWRKSGQALVTDWADCVYRFAPVRDGAGGYQGVSCGAAAFSRSELGEARGAGPVTRRGTSLAAPRRLNLWLREKAGVDFPPSSDMIEVKNN